MKKLILSFLLIFSTSSISAQGSANAEKCFPSGSSLIGANLNTDRTLIKLSNVLGKDKIFDVNTMELIDPQKYKVLDAGFYSMAGPANFRLERKFDTHQTGKPQTYTVFDKSGKLMYEYSVKEMSEEYFYRDTGYLILQYDDSKEIILRPKEKNIKFDRADINWYDGPVVFSKDLNYLLFFTGTIVNLKTREVRTKEFKPYKIGYTTATDIVVSDNGNNYAINNANNEIEIHNLATGKLVKKFAALPTLPKIEGFQLIPLPKEGDYIYWLLFNNKYATGGLAYLVKNGKATSFCDPLWDQESDANYAKNLQELLENYKDVERRKLENEKIAQQNNAGKPSMSDILIAQAEERKKVLAEKSANDTVQNTSTATSSQGQNYTQPAKTYNEIVNELRQVQKERNESSDRDARMEEYRKRP